MHKADILPPSCAVVVQSGNLNFLEPSGPIQACNGTALPLPLRTCRLKRNSEGTKQEGHEVRSSVPLMKLRIINFISALRLILYKECTWRCLN